MNIHKILFAGKLALSLILGLVIVRTVLFAGQIERAFTPASALGTEKLQLGLAVRSPGLSVVDYAQIVANNPFGRPARAGGKGLAVSGSSVSKQMGLVLLGTISGNPMVARAIIRDVKSKDVDLYKTGQTVGSARIETIEKEQVVLLYAGERRVLKLETLQSGHGINPTRTYLPRSAARTAGSITDDSPTEKTASTFRTKIARVEAVLKNATIEPYIVDGQVEGLRITGLEKIKAAKELGLKNGDVIQVVNGQRLTSKQKAYQIFKKARSQPVITFELLRDNRTKELSFVLR